MSEGESDDHSVWRNFPPDIIPHLLSRLPLKSLCRFKCVSHSWKSLISSPYFDQTRIRSTNTNNPQKAILISNSNSLYSVDLSDLNPTAKKLDFSLFELSHDKWFQFYSSCNGLLLVSHEDKSNFLWNPSTGEYKKLPESPFSVLDPVHYRFYPYLYGVGYDSSTDDYKVVMLACYPNTTKVAVYSLKTDAWRRIKGPYYPMFPSRGVHLNERLHGVWRSGRLDGSHGIVAFDMSNEIFREVPLPDSFVKYEIVDQQMAVAGGCLCLIVRSSCDQFFEVWMMKEYRVRESWTKLTIDSPAVTVLNLLCLLSEDDLVLTIDAGFLYRVNGDEDELVVYNMEKKTLSGMVIPGIPTEFRVGATYIETLVSPDHIGQTRRQCEAS